METTTTFVLGILCGSFLLGIVYGVIGIVKMKKSQKQLQATVTDLNSGINDLHRRINELHKRFTEVIFEENHKWIEKERELDTRFDEIHRTSDETRKYIDSRIDKSIDVLCQRMDILKDEQEQLIKS